MSTTDTNPVSSTYEVSGMTCSHCVKSVTEEVSQLDGVRDVRVDLVAGGVSTVTVQSTGALDRDVVATAVDEAGYQLVDAS
jgi:copper chaperone